MQTMPTWEDYMIPSLRALSDGEVHRARDLYEAAADDLGVTESQRAELIPSGQPRYINRALWGLSYLFRGGAADRPSRGHYAITETGRQLLAEHPDGLVKKDLKGLPGYVSVSGGEGAETEAAEEDAITALSPNEQIEDAVTQLHTDVAAELLTRLHANESVFFEQAGQPRRLHHDGTLQQWGSGLRQRGRDPSGADRWAAAGVVDDPVRRRGADQAHAADRRGGRGLLRVGLGSTATSRADESSGCRGSV